MAGTAATIRSPGAIYLNINVALLGADGQDDPEVHLDLARLADDVAGKALAITNFDGSISYSGTANPDGTWTFDLDGYQAVYDPVKGDLSSRLPTLLAAPRSKITPWCSLTPMGSRSGHGVRVASTTDHNDMTTIAWKALKVPNTGDRPDLGWRGNMARILPTPASGLISVLSHDKWRVVL